MARKADVLRLHAEHPDWSSSEIAEQLDCESSYVRATFYRNGLRLPNNRETRANSIYSLGRAAKMAGLTMKDIEAMRSARATP